jgi:hypothetical protein
MGANPKRRERWPIPRTTRHVWVLRDHRWEVPWQGYVIAWRRHSYKWSALVAYVDESDPERPLVQRWVPRDKLLPVRSAPEDLIGNPFNERLWREQFGG